MITAIENAAKNSGPISVSGIARQAGAGGEGVGVVWPEHPHPVVHKWHPIIEILTPLHKKGPP